MKTLLMLLLLAVPIFSQNIEIKYDKFKDESRAFIYQSGNPAVMWGFKYHGQAITKDIDTFSVYFSGRGCPGYCFNDPSLILLIDGRRVDLSDGRDRLSDGVLFFIDRATMLKIVNAKLVEYQVGRFEGQWKDNIKGLKALFDLGTTKKD